MNMCNNQVLEIIDKDRFVNTQSCCCVQLLSCFLPTTRLWSNVFPLGAGHGLSTIDRSLVLIGARRRIANQIQKSKLILNLNLIDIPLPTLSPPPYDDAL